MVRAEIPVHEVGVVSSLRMSQSRLQPLEQTRSNKTKAAQLLGITFRSLRYRIKKLGIE